MKSKDNYYYPSTLYGCKRKTLFSKLSCNKENTTNAQGIFRLDTGTYIHNRWTDYWRALGVLYGDWYCTFCEQVTKHTLCPEICIHCGKNKLRYNEVPIRSEKLKISAIADGILIMKDRRILWECKSINNKGFKELEKTGIPKPEHFFQANIYAHMLNIVGENIWIKYENKDTQKSKDFFMEKDGHLFKQAINTIDIIESAIEDEKLLSREHKNKNIPPCMWCDYVGLCFKTHLTFRKVLDSVNIE